MSTIYILHGGETSKESPLNEKFYSYFTDLINKDHVKVLICLWARNPAKREMALEKHTQNILKNTSKTVEISLAKDPQDLLSRIIDYDVLYIDAGYAENIEPFYKDLVNLKSKLESKVCIGSSMGAFAISTHYVLSYDDQDTTHVHAGLGLLPVNSLVHWNMEDNKQEKIALLKKVSDLPIVILDECELVKIIY